jgi:hypothetical protein
VLKTENRQNTYFYNATNLSALTYYADQALITSIAAPLNAPAKRQQAGIVSALARYQPDLVLLDVPEKQFLWKLSWRSYFIYRYLLNNYYPFEKDGLIFGRKRSPDSELSAEQVELFTKALSRYDLGGIPSSWGRSHNTLAKQMRFVVRVQTLPKLYAMREKEGIYSATGNGAALEYAVSGMRIDGTEAGLLCFNLKLLAKENHLPLRVAWKDGEKNFSVTFQASSGKQIVPLDAFPTWIFAKDIQSIKIEPVISSEEAVSFSLSDLSFMQRN